jgi:hypothetical protein
MNQQRFDGIPRSGCKALEENALGFVPTMNTSLGSGERQLLIVHSSHKAKTTSNNALEGVLSCRSIMIQGNSGYSSKCQWCTTTESYYYLN